MKLKALLLIFTLTWSTICLSQNFSMDFGVGFGAKQMSGDFGFNINNFSMLADISFPYEKGIIGENYSSAINWKQYPEDHISEGEYLTIFNIGIGYSITSSFSFYALIGYGDEKKYVNCFDNLYILGDEGDYYLTKPGDSQMNVGFMAKYYIPITNNFYFYFKGKYCILEQFQGGGGISFGF